VLGNSFSKPSSISDKLHVISRDFFTLSVNLTGWDFG
jgi:hypothetical protein